MMLFILDKNPRGAVKYLINNSPKILYTKQLLELGQLISSCGYSNIYKKVNQGIEIQKWILKNTAWTYRYYGELLKGCLTNSGYNYNSKTISKFYSIYRDIRRACLGMYTSTFEPETGIFRYTEEYKESNYPSNSEIPIEECVEEYKKYLNWKVNTLSKKNKTRNEICQV